MRNGSGTEVERRGNQVEVLRKRDGTPMEAGGNNAERNRNILERKRIKIPLSHTRQGDYLCNKIKRMKQEQESLLDSANEVLSQIKALSANNPDILLRVRIIEEILHASIRVSTAIGQGKMEIVEMEIKELHKKIKQLTMPRFESGGFTSPL